MTEPQFRDPIFLPDNYQPKDFEHKPGKIVIAKELDGLPPNVLERIKEQDPDFKSDGKYVIKQYKDDQVTRNMLLGYDVEALSQQREVADISLPEIVRILMKRQKMMKDFFADLPRSVVKSHFFIARPEDLLNQEDELDKEDGTTKAKDGKNTGGDQENFAIYEVQEKLENCVYLSSEREKIEKFVQNLSPEERARLMAEIMVLRKKISEIVLAGQAQKFEGNIPDLHSGNVAITQDGEVKIIDTNVVFNRQFIGYTQGTLKDLFGDIQLVLAQIEKVDSDPVQK